MPDVLRVSALQLGHPVALRVGMETHDAPLSRPATGLH